MFSQNELKQIEAAVAEAESHTSGEIVVFFTERSAGYRWVPWAAALLLSLVAPLLAWAMAWREAWQFSPIILLEVQALSAAAAFALTSWGPLRQRLIGKSEMARRVHAGALARFVLSGVAATRGRTGILVYLSAFERRVEILADSGIHKMVGPDYWTTQVNGIVAGIRSGKATDAVCEAVLTMGNRLSELFPRRPDDKNELPNTPTTQP